MNGTFFTLEGRELSTRAIDGLHKYDLLRAFFETVNSAEQAGDDRQKALWFAADCVNRAAALSGRGPVLTVSLP